MVECLKLIMVINLEKNLEMYCSVVEQFESEDRIVSERFGTEHLVFFAFGMVILGGITGSDLLHFVEERPGMVE